MIIVTRQGKQLVRENCRIFIESDKEIGSHFVWTTADKYPLSWFGSKEEAEDFVKRIQSSNKEYFFIVKEEEFYGV